MRVIVYDEETREPITIIALPFRELQKAVQRPVWRVAVYPPLHFGPPLRDDEISRQVIQVVELRIVRSGDSWHAFTKQGELAMQLPAAFLPGQKYSARRHLSATRELLS
jgi:hypothetical protein